MFALLLTAAFTAPVTPTEEVMFPTGQRVTVTGPTNLDDGVRWSPPWTHEQTLLSPRGDAAAVRFCWDAIKYHGCQVYLARPSQPVMELKNSNVTRLLWTEDGKYLMGAGENTVRLWNLVGGVRTAVPAPGAVFSRLTRSSSRIVGLTLSGRDLCVRTEDAWSDTNGRQADRSVSVTRYALPSLKPLEILSFTVSDGPDVPCHLPHTEP